MPGPGAPGTPIMSSPQGNDCCYQIYFFVLLCGLLLIIFVDCSVLLKRMCFCTGLPDLQNLLQIYVHW